MSVEELAETKRLKLKSKIKTNIAYEGKDKVKTVSYMINDGRVNIKHLITRLSWKNNNSLNHKENRGQK